MNVHRQPYGAAPAVAVFRVVFRPAVLEISPNEGHGPAGVMVPKADRKRWIILGTAKLHHRTFIGWAQPGEGFDPELYKWSAGPRPCLPLARSCIILFIAGTGQPV